MFKHLVSLSFALNESCDSDSSDKLEASKQRVNLQFFVKFCKIVDEAYAIVKISSAGECLSRTQVFHWFYGFKKGREKFI